MRNFVTLLFFSRVSMNHDHLILLMSSLGYLDSSGDGICHGFTMMWVQAACHNQLDAFYQRLEFIKEFIEKPSSLVQALEDARQKVRNKESLSTEDAQLLEVSAFFDGISVYQGTLHSNTLAQDSGSQLLNLERNMTWVRPQCAQDRLHKVSCAGQYTEAEFSDFLTHLAQASENRKNIVFTVNIPTHTLGLLYAGDGLFQIMDINVKDFRPSPLVAPQECANLLFNHLFYPDLFHNKLLLRTTAFAVKRDNLPDLSFEHQKNTPPYMSIEINEISFEKWTNITEILCFK